MIFGIKATLNGISCTKFVYKGFELSLVLDDNCGASHVYNRTYLAVFNNDDKEITEEVFDENQIYGFGFEEFFDYIVKFKNFVDNKFS